MPDASLYVDVTLRCIRAVSFCTPQLREELTKLSLLALYRAFETRRFTDNFWSFTSRVIEILHDQVSREYYGKKLLLTNVRISRSNSLISSLILSPSASKLSKRLTPTKQ